jgi:hypothetical protein
MGSAYGSSAGAALKRKAARGTLDHRMRSIFGPFGRTILQAFERGSIWLRSTGIRARFSGATATCRRRRTSSSWKGCWAGNRRPESLCVRSGSRHRNDDIPHPWLSIWHPHFTTRVHRCELHRYQGIAKRPVPTCTHTLSPRWKESQRSGWTLIQFAPVGCGPCFEFSARFGVKAHPSLPAPELV